MRLPSDRKLSVAIPYKQRLDNLRLTFAGLAEQTMPSDEFEVVVGAMEHSDEYVELCREFSDRIDIVSVLSSRDFEIPQARNLAMRQATGEVVVQMDADTLLPPSALHRLYDQSFAFGQDVCVVGQVVGYGNNHDGDVDSVELLPYEEYRRAVHDAASCVRQPMDPRFQVDHVISWAFAWTGLIALRRATVWRHELWFDEDFHGWGGDDLDWGYRICASGTPIVLRPDIYALHLPHTRDTAANRLTERVNYRRILQKWPRPDVELANAFGDFDANGLYLEFLAERRMIIGDDHRGLGTVWGSVDGVDVVVMGVLLDDRQQIVDRGIVAELDQHGISVLPLAGLSLPFDDRRFDECRVLPSLAGFSATFWAAVVAEAERVAKQVTFVQGV